jgi:hypothetical protein
MATELSVAVRERDPTSWLLGLTWAAVSTTVTLLSSGGQSELVMQTGRCGIVL